jgi:selenide,water dikinase
MLKLNRQAAEAMQNVYVHAATDVTGFGLLGHLHEMVSGGEVGARVELSNVPVLSAAWELAAQDCFPEGSHNNHRYLADFVDYKASISREESLLLCDAQTSGGLLIAVTPERVDNLLGELAETPTPGMVIGEILPQPKGRIQVRV